MDDGLRQWVEAGLFDPTQPDPNGFADALAFFTSIGVVAGDFADVEPAEVIGEVNRRMLRPGERLTAERVRTEIGLDPEPFGELLRASGYRSDDAFTPLDLEAFRSFGAASQLFSPEALFHFSRVLSSAMARVADATSALFRVDIGTRIEAEGGAEVDYARKNAESAQLVDQIFPPMRAFFLRQMMDAVRLSDAARRTVTSGAATTLNVAVGFVDVVGYSSMASRTAPDDLARFIGTFESNATAVVAEHGGRLVKLIGDEVMFVTVEPAQAVGVVTALHETFDGSGAIPRGGVAYGESIAIGGDYYGTVVNLAARLVDEAIPGEALVDRATADRVGDHWTIEPAGRRSLKGFDDPVDVFTVSRAN